MQVFSGDILHSNITDEEVDLNTGHVPSRNLETKAVRFTLLCSRSFGVHLNLTHWAFLEPAQMAVNMTTRTSTIHAVISASRHRTWRRWKEHRSLFHSVSTLESRLSQASFIQMGQYQKLQICLNALYNLYK